MEKMNDLRDLLKHEIEDLCSVEEQIIDALPAMIEKASNTALKISLTDHLRITEQQRDRLGKVLQMLSAGNEEDNGGKKKKFLGLFGGGSHKCKGMEGIISEGKKMMNIEMDPDVMDAAIIACAQKVEHYEICGYGTARSFASELGLNRVASLLELTLDEEYDADDKLTFLAESRINKQAERNENSALTAAASGKTSRQNSRSTARRKEMELEPVSSRRQNSETKKEQRQERGGQPKSASTPRSSSGRSASTSSKTASHRSHSASASSKRGENSRKGNTGGARNR
jgi:ferritin-like metal-binding protein YciE